MNLETKITIYKFTPQLFTLTLLLPEKEICSVFSSTSYIFSFGVTALCWFFFNAGGIVCSAWV